MSGGHTPGPWKIVDINDETRINVRGPNDEFIADCADGFWSEATDGWIMAEESLPNARLIAAAPELLSAAKVLASLQDPDFMGAGRRTPTKDEIAVALSAIAKATDTLAVEAPSSIKGGVNDL